MGLIEKICQVLNSNVLDKNLITIPEKGADNIDILEEEKKLPRSLSPFHKKLLSKWNGIDLEVIRFYGVGNSPGIHGSLIENQYTISNTIEMGIVVGSDPAGFIYIEDKDYKIHMLDIDGGNCEIVASSLDDLIVNFIFGVRAKEFGGDEWFCELMHNKIIEQ